MSNFEVDYVFPYVNNNDSVWRKCFIDYCKRIHRGDKLRSIDGERYEDLGLLPYLIECLNKNLPWIRKIHIIVSNKEQLPKSIRENPKVNMVLHTDIMPSSVLPTFNSTTIEMYLRRVPDLTEHFIYGNDDMFPISKLEPEDFFSEDGLSIKSNVRINDTLNNQFRYVCLNNTLTVAKCFNLKTGLAENEYFRPMHGVTPMLKSHCWLVVETCGKDIFKYVDAFRTEKQHNQYIYPVYEKLTNNCLDSEIMFKYVSYKNTLDEIINAILDENIQIICINDTPGAYRQDILNNKQLILAAFEERLSRDE